MTAAAQAVDNATSETIQEIASPQTTEDGTTGEVVDAKSDYASRLGAFLSGKGEDETSPVVQPAAAPPPAAVVNPPEDPEDAPLIKDGQMPKMRVRTVTPVDVEAVAAFQTSQRLGNTQSLVEFIAENFVPKLPPTQQTAEAPAPETGTTLASIEAEIEAMENQRDELLEGFELEQAEELKPKLKDLRAKHKEMLLKSVAPPVDPEDAQAAAEEPYLIRAAQMFPQSVEASSPLAMKAREIHAKWTADKDPRAAHPSSAFYCYVDAAAELNIKPSAAPASQPQVTPPPSTTSPVHRPPASALIAGGDARSLTTRTPKQTGTYQERLRAHLAATAS